MPKPLLNVSNIVLGQASIDLSGKIEATNHSTGDTVELNFEPKTRSAPSKIKGTGYDKHSNKLFEISGSWLDAITLKDIRGCSSEQVWTSVASPNPQQYGFNHPFTLSMN